MWVDDHRTLNFTHVALDECLNSATLVETLDRHRHHAPDLRLSSKTSFGLPKAFPRHRLRKTPAARSRGRALKCG